MNNPKNSYHRRLILTLKLAFGLSLIGYVISVKWIDFSRLSEVLFSPFGLLFSMGLLFLIAYVMSLRIYYFSQTKTQSITKKEVFDLSMIGIFLGTFFPGTIGGDIIRAWYLKKCGIERNVQIILWERGIGLTTTCFLASVATFSIKTDKIDPSILSQLKMFSVLTTVILSLIGISAFIIGKENFKESKNKLLKMAQFLVAYKPSFRNVVISVFLSLLSVLLTIVFGQFCGSVLGYELSMIEYLLIIPLGTLASSIPLLPLGIGIGQVAYANLFQWLTDETAANGATLCTLMQCYSVIYSLFGIIPYFQFSKSKSLRLKIDEKKVS